MKLKKYPNGGQIYSSSNSVLGAIGDEINKRHNTTTDPQLKKDLIELKTKITSLPRTKLRGQDELDYYSKIDPRAKDLIDQAVHQKVFSKYGINPPAQNTVDTSKATKNDLSIVPTNGPTGTYANGGNIRYKTNNVDPNGFNDYYSIMANGGNIQQPNAELEDGEVFRTPDGNMEKVNGRTHAQGGEQYNLPEGTQILGKMQSPEFQKQYKQLGDKLKNAQDKYEKVLKNRPTTIAKQTAMMMLNKAHTAFDGLMKEQESQKSNNPQEGTYANGGQIPKYGLGSFASGIINTGVGLFSKPKQYDAYKYDPNSSSNYTAQDVSYTNIKDPDKLSYTNLNADNYQNPYEQQSLDAIRSQTSTYNADPELEANKLASSAYDANVRNSGATGGAALGLLGAGQINRMRANSSTLANKQNTETNLKNAQASQLAGALGTFGQQRANTNLGVAQYNSNMGYQTNAANIANQSQTNQFNASNALQTNQFNSNQKANAYQMNSANQLNAYNTNMNTNMVNAGNKAAKWNMVTTGIGQTLDAPSNMINESASLGSSLLKFAANGGVIGKMKSLKKPSAKNTKYKSK